MPQGTEQWVSRHKFPSEAPQALGILVSGDQGSVLLSAMERVTHLLLPVTHVVALGEWRCGESKTNMTSGSSAVPWQEDAVAAHGWKSCIVAQAGQEGWRGTATNLSARGSKLRKWQQKINYLSENLASQQSASKQPQPRPSRAPAGAGTAPGTPKALGTESDQQKGLLSQCRDHTRSPPPQPEL